MHVLALHGRRARERPARLSPIAYSKEPVRGERPLPLPPTGDKKDGAWQQFMGRKADWIIHCQGHARQQRWHLAAQKPRPPGQHVLRAGHIPGDRQVSGGPGEEREGRIPEKCLRGWPDRPMLTLGSTGKFVLEGWRRPWPWAGQLSSAGLGPGAGLSGHPPHPPTPRAAPLPCFPPPPAKIPLAESMLCAVEVWGSVSTLLLSEQKPGDPGKQGTLAVPGASRQGRRSELAGPQICLPCFLTGSL